MNKRIKELAVDAGMIVYESNGFDKTQLMPKEVKFAELIIQDCTSIIANQGKFLGYVALEEKVKKHFGIDSPK